ncbi:MAG: precorrin-2 C(20)-methyltransferase [Pseudomonadota bacterium]
MSGTLYGVGLGPGDPDLMTLKAHRLISQADVIAYPAPAGGDSFARSIAAEAINSKATEIVIPIPMAIERFPAQDIYDKAVAEIRPHLDAGRDVITLCEGDPFFYGSFMYLFARLAEDYATEIIPGVASMTACAAAAQLPLCARNEVLTVIPGPLEEEALKARLQTSGAAAIMKVGRHLPKLRRIIEDLGLTDRADYVERATLPNEKRMKLADAPDKAPYFSMILIAGSDPYASR